MFLHEYLAAFHNSVGKIDDYGYAESIDIRVERRAAKQAVITADIFLVDGSNFYIKYIDAKYAIEKIDYAYHYQDREGQLKFRYDNAPHRPDLGFSDHKHLSDGSIVESSTPDISDVVDEVLSSLM